jgi:phosphatidylethanolamine/phosphatidyl-N-methylethanolamine N-methyltransferase
LWKNDKVSQRTDRQETARTEARYDRIAPIYDLIEVLPEQQFRSWREKVWAQVPEGRVLEVGVGTGRNLPYHPPGVQVVGIDISERMLRRAQQRAEELGKTVELYQMDAQRLDFSDDSFDAAVATFIFCSVPDAVQGLRELGRVVKPEGKILLLEHVRINKPEAIGKVMDLLDPMVMRLVGPLINRCTEENVRRAGLEVDCTEALTPMDLVKLIFARPADRGAFQILMI